jgi:anti-sigma B factor antagonist
MRPKKAQIKVEYGTDVTIATFGSQNILEEPQMRELEAELLGVIAANEDRKLVLNFENVAFMSSAFLGLLVKVHKRVIEAGGRLQLFNLDPRIYKVFEITNLTKVFDIQPARP